MVVFSMAEYLPTKVTQYKSRQKNLVYLQVS